MDFITVPDRNEVRESGQEVMHYFIFKCPEKGVLGSTDPICNCSKDVKRGRNEQISYGNYTLAFPLRKTLSVHPGRGPDNDKWVLMEKSK